MLDTEVNLKTKFLRNLGFGAVSRIAQTFVGFFIITYVIKTVGIKNWGVLTVSVSIVTLLSLLQVSLSGGTGKRLTDFYIKQDQHEYRKYYSGTILISMLIILIIGFFALIYDFFFIGSLVQANQFRLIFYLTVVNSIGIVLTLPGSAVLQSINRVDVVAKISTLGFVCRAVLVLTVFLFNKSIISYVIILLTETTINLILTYFIANREAKTFSSITLRKIDSSYLFYIFKFNFLNFINSLNYLFFIELPAILIAKKFGLTFSGYYGIGIQLNSLIRGFLNIIMNALSPVFNILKAQDKNDKLIQSYDLSNKLFVFIAILLFGGSNFFLKDIIFIWLGNVDESMVLFLKYFVIFTSVGIAFIPSALMVVTLEKLKSTSYIGLLLSLLVSVGIYFTPNNVNQYVFVPVILTFGFAIYNIHRAYISFKALNITISSLKRVLLFLFVCVGFVIFFNNYFLDQLYLNGVITLLLITISSIFLFTRNDYRNLISILKK